MPKASPSASSTPIGHPENERGVADVLRDELDVPVSASHEVLAEFREYERTSTTAVDAYVTPAIDAYIGRLEERAGERGVPEPRIMQANGGIAVGEDGPRTRGHDHDVRARGGRRRRGARDRRRTATSPASSPSTWAARRAT